MEFSGEMKKDKKLILAIILLLGVIFLFLFDALVLTWRL